MLTENEARDLLNEAARTIHVDAAEPPTVVPAPRRWPYVVAAAAVLAMVGTIAVLAGGPRAGISPAPQPSPPTSSGSLGPDRMPSVFAYDEASARAMLESLGLDVSVAAQPSCSETYGRAVRTLPAAGSDITSGQHVTLFVSQSPPTAFCIWDDGRARAWEFMDFANGRGPAPAFSPTVRLIYNGQPTATLSGAEAADPASWGDPSALTLIREASATFPPPTLAVWKAGQPSCWGNRVQGQAPLVLSIDSYLGAFGGKIQCPTTVALYHDSHGRISGVSATSGTPLGSVAVPNVVGVPIEAARVVLRGVGLQVEYVQKGAPPPVGCDSSELVAAQDPESGTLAPTGSTVALTLRWVGCERTVTHGPGPGSTTSNR